MTVDVSVEITNPDDTIQVEVVSGIPGAQGPTSGVTSVNGATGVVVLDAGDVGADAAGTAAGLVDDLSGVTDAAQARTSLGLGTAATADVGDLAVPASRTAVYLGTSVTYAGGTGAFGTAGTSLSSGCWAVWVQALTHWRLNPFNAGVSGNTTTDMLARLQTDVIALAPGICVFEPGPNDAKGAVSAATSQANITAILDAFQDAGIYCILLTMTPSNLIDTTAEKQALFTVNRWIREQQYTRRGLTVVDVYPYVSDPSSVAWATGYSTDLTHPIAAGASPMAVPVAIAINTLFPKSTPLTEGGGDPYELLPNPRMAGNTAGVATSVTRTGGTGTASKVTRTDGVFGEWQQWVAISGTNFIIQEVTTGFSVGDSLYAMMELESDASGWASTTHELILECRDNANTSLGLVVVGGVTTTEPQPSSAVWVTNPLVVPSGTTKVRVYNWFKGAGTIRIGRMCLRKVGT